MTSLDQEVALLRGVPFLSSIEAGKLKLLAYSSLKLGFEDGEIVFRQGATDGDAYFILEGSVDVLTERNGREVRVAQLPQYALFGEISALCDIPRTATVRARGHLVALRIPKESFVELISSSSGAALQVIRVLARRVADTTSDLAAALDARGSN
jgi:CRP-like cAMP-binding protein